jgi:hypothetical protein
VGKTPYIRRNAIELIVCIMFNPTNEIKDRLRQFRKRNLAFRKTIAKRQKELDASQNARRTRFSPAV